MRMAQQVVPPKPQAKPSPASSTVITYSAVASVFTEAPLYFVPHLHTLSLALPLSATLPPSFYPLVSRPLLQLSPPSSKHLTLHVTLPLPLAPACAYFSAFGSASTSATVSACFSVSATTSDSFPLSSICSSLFSFTSTR